MKQLTGLDAAFLHLETPAQFGHVSGLAIFERPKTRGYDPYQAWHAQLEERLHLLEPLRRRLREVPLGLDNPYWINDPDFDLDYHVRHTAVPPPGNDEQLCNTVARIVGRPLDRSRPLWLSYVIEGLSDDRFAVLTLVHHAAIDGASGVELMTLMFDETVDGRSTLPPPRGRWRTEGVPSDIEMLIRTTIDLPLKPARAIVLAARTLGEIGQATRSPALVAWADRMRASVNGPLGAILNLGRDRGDRDRPTRGAPVRPPRTPFNDAITPHRGLAIGSASLSTVREIKRELGATVNDVVVAACAGGLRTWLETHEALPGDPLVALVPVSVRTGDESDRWTNRVSMITTVLPTDEPDAAKRVEIVHEAMTGSKGLFDALPAERLTDFAEFPPPAVFARAMRLSARLRLGSRLIPGNLVISNVPGPRTPLYAAGARLLHYYPVSVILEGQGLNITVQSYEDHIDFGIVYCPELVPDGGALLDAILADIDALAKRTASPKAVSPTRKEKRPKPADAPNGRAHVTA